MNRRMYLLCSLFFLFALSLNAQVKMPSKEEMVEIFQLQEMSEAGIDSFHRHYEPNVKFFRPWNGSGLFATSDQPYDKKMEVMDHVLKPIMSQKDYLVLKKYWDNSYAQKRAYLEDVAMRYGKYKACIEPVIDSLEKIYKNDFMSVKDKILTELTEKQSKAFRKEFKKYKDLHKITLGQFSQGKVYMSELDSLSYTNYQFILQLPLMFPAQRNKHSNYTSDSYLSEIEDYGYFDQYHQFDLALGSYACDTCYIEASIGRACYYTSQLESKKDSLSSQRNAMYYLLMHENASFMPVQKEINDTIPHSYMKASLLVFDDIVDDAFFLKKGYKLSTWKPPSSTSRVYSFGEQASQMLVLDFQQTLEKRKEVIPILNKQIKEGQVDIYTYPGEKVYLMREDGGLKGYIFMIAKDNELFVLGIMNGNVSDPKAWFEEHRGGIRF